eukprot:COSAG02_NODE_1179_length_14040_cov_8.036439_2_plen_695_part_00
MEGMLKEITQYGSDRLSKLSTAQRRAVKDGLSKLSDETAKTLRTHTIQALNPRANPRDTITALLAEMKSFIAGVNETVTEECLDRWDSGIAGYNKDLPIKIKIILQAWADAQVAEHAKKRERSEKELEKRLERMRHSCQTDVDARTQQIRVAVQQEQEAIVTRLEAQIAEKDVSIADAVARAQSSEELVESLRTKLLDRTRVLEEANEVLKQEARIQQRHFDMQIKHKNAELAKLKAEFDAVARQKQGIAASPTPASSPLPPLLEPELQPEPEVELDTPTRSLEAAREMAAVTRKLQTAMDNVARVTKERDMLLTMMSDREDRNTGIATMMEELSAVKQELLEIKAERDLLFDAVQKQKTRDDSSLNGSLELPEAKQAPEPITELGAKPAAAVYDTVASPIEQMSSIEPASATVGSATVDTVIHSGSGDGADLARNIEEIVTKDRGRRVELEAHRTEVTPAISGAAVIKQRRDTAVAARGGIALPFGHEGPKPQQPSERQWASHIQRNEGTSGKAGLLRKRPGSAPPSSQRVADTSSGSNGGRRSSPVPDDRSTVSVINLNEDMALEQAVRGSMFGSTADNTSLHAPLSPSPQDEVASFLVASASSIGNVTSELMMLGPSEHRLASGMPPRPHSAGDPRRRSLGSHLQNRRRPPERRTSVASRRQPRAGSWRTADILQTGTSGLSVLERRLSRG